MAGRGGFAITISAADKASAPIEAINKRLAKLSAPAERFNKALTKFGDTSGISRVSEGVTELGRTAATTFQSLDRLSSPLAAITGAASIAGMVELTRRWGEFGNQVANTAYRMNLPVEKLGNLRGAARLAGSSAGALDQSLLGLGQTLSGAAFGRNPHAVQLLTQLHIGFGDASHGARQAEDALGDVAEAIQKLPDARTQERVLGELGISPDLLPMLKNGRKGLEDLRKKSEATGSSMTKQMTDDASAMNAAWQRLGLDFEGVSNRIVDSWSGTVTKVLSGTSDWIEHNQKLSASIAEIGTTVGALAALPGLAKILRLVGLGAVSDAAIPVAAAAATLSLSGDTPGGGDYGREAARQAGGKVWDQWQEDHPGPIGWLWRQIERPLSGWGGGSSAGRGAAIAVPKAPTAAAAVMQRGHDFWKSKGLTEQQIAGELVTEAAESRFDPNAYNPDDNGSPSYGLYQHHGGRLDAMRGYFHTDRPSEDQQREWMYREYTQGSLKGVWDRLTHARTAQEATGIVTEGEAPANTVAEGYRRARYAEQFVQPDGRSKDDGFVRPNSESGAWDAGVSGADGSNGAPGANGHVQVDVNIKGAHPGTTAKITTAGAVQASPPRIETPLPMVN